MSHARLAKLFVILCLVCFVSSCVESEDQKKIGPEAVVISGVFSPYGLFSKPENKVPYGLLVPRKSQNSKKFPLILSLHSSGSDAQRDLEHWKEAAVKHGFMVVSISRKRAYKNIDSDLRPLYYLIQNILFWYPVDRSKVFIAGTSSGCLTVEWLLQKYSKFWKKAVLMSPPEFIGWAAKVDVKTLPPILVIHGALDQQFRIKDIEQNVKTLASRGGKIELVTDAEKDHGNHPEWNERAMEWLSRGNKN